MALPAPSTGSVVSGWDSRLKIKSIVAGVGAQPSLMSCMRDGVETAREQREQASVGHRDLRNVRRSSLIK